MVVVAGVTVILFPVPTRVPPQEPLYQFQVAPVPNEPPTTDKVVEPPHVGLVEALIDVAAVELVFTVMVIDAHVVLPQVP